MAETEEAPAGVGRDGPPRPPTTGMLPADNLSGEHGPLILFAVEAEIDTANLQSIPAITGFPGYRQPELRSCAFVETLWAAKRFYPDIIVIGASNLPAWSAYQASLCRLLKHELAADNPAIVLIGELSDHAELRSEALHPDLVVPPDVPAVELARLLHTLLVKDFKGQDDQERG